MDSGPLVVWVWAWVWVSIGMGMGVYWCGYGWCGGRGTTIDLVVALGLARSSALHQSGHRANGPNFEQLLCSGVFGIRLRSARLAVMLPLLGPVSDKNLEWILELRID